MGSDDASRWAGAECANLDPKELDLIFFDQKGRPPNNPPYKVFCDPCPIKGFCLAYAIVHDEEGVWGGLTKSQRDSLPSKVKQELTAEAVRQGWYEERLSVDEILRLGRSQQPEVEQEWTAPVVELVIQEFQFEFEVQQVSGNLAFANFPQPEQQVPESSERALAISLPPLEELLAAPILPNVLPQICTDSTEFRFDFEVL